MPAIGDEETAVVRGQNLPGIAEEARRRLRRLTRERERPADKRPVLQVRVDETPGEVHERLERDLAGLLRHHAALRIEEGERRPGPHRVGTPGAEVPVVDDGMVDAEPEAGIGEVRSSALGGELTRVHPDDHEHVVKPLLELPDPREQVEAVDSAVRPEVEDDDLAAQVGDAEWALDVEPVESLQELRRAYGGQGGERHGRRAHGSPADAVTASLKGRPTMLVDTLVHGSVMSSVRRVVALGDQVGPSSPDSMFNVTICFSLHDGVSWLRRSTGAPRSELTSTRASRKSLTTQQARYQR